ncbi:hypothetical protein M9H77_17368 [Catharanthus roseus]|uniref:Uncharacterized protein n=1 Tax=Catharanthus roseus TaxID=4058 RepID=A0ACC0B4E7_CATRO|nr:hypothetical protein M9H77_17368 [Catharanthus roseus]
MFYRNYEESNVLSDIAVAHPTSIAMMRERKNFTVATAFMCNEQATTYRWVLQQIKHLYIISDMETGPGSILNKVLHFGVETTNRAESEHSVLKLWLSTCHGDLDTVFLNIDSLIEGQIAEIKYSLEISKLKERFTAKSNAILKNRSNKISHLALKKIWLEIKKAHKIVENPESNCLHYLRKSHGVPCACELIHRSQYLIPIQLEDVYIFWRKLEIGSDIPDIHERDMDSEMRDLTSMLEEISTGPISKAPEVRRLIKGVICPVLPEDPCPLLTNPPRTTVTKGRRKTNSTKKDKSHWEYVSIAHWKIGKSSSSRSGSRSSSGSRSGPSPRGRGRPSRSGRGKGRGRNSGRSSISSVVNMDAPSTPFPFINAFPKFMYDFIKNWKNVVGDKCITELVRKTSCIEGSAPVDYWMDTPDHLYVIANTFNLCVILIARVGSTTVLPLYSNMDCTVGMLFIGFIVEQEYFIQELSGITGTLVQDSVSKCEGASSHSASTKVLLTTYILLFGDLRAS